MRWQDIVIGLAQICFVFALLPSLRSHHKPAASTCVMNVLLISTITVCLFTLKLWFSALTACSVDIAWVVLAFQKIKLDKLSKKV